LNFYNISYFTDYWLQR